MTDLEIIKLCAEAMGYKIDYSTTNGGGYMNTGFNMDGAAVLDWHNGITFNPLKNDAQAMALVKKFRLDIYAIMGNNWEALFDDNVTKSKSINADLNRAICECVAKMQSVKVAA